PPEAPAHDAACPPDVKGEPPTVGGGGSAPLSDKLAQSKGVICPPSGVDREMQVAPPDGGRLKGIPPPGTPGGGPNVQPEEAARADVGARRTRSPAGAQPSAEARGRRGDADGETPRQPEHHEVGGDEGDETGVRSGVAFDQQTETDGDRLANHQGDDEYGEQAHGQAPLALIACRETRATSVTGSIAARRSVAPAAPTRCRSALLSQGCRSTSQRAAQHRRCAVRPCGCRSPRSAYGAPDICRRFP